MNTVIVLVMHGMPPKDFPIDEKKEMFRLVAQVGHDKNHERLMSLDRKMRDWPRTAENDPFHTAALELQEQLEEDSGCKVILGYNEFCAPDFDAALDKAAALSAEKVVIVTPMVTRGGSHAESEIPQAIEAARKRHPRVKFEYAWPFDTNSISKFLTEQFKALVPQT